MTQFYISVPDALSATRNPIRFKVATNNGPGIRQMMALYRVEGYALNKIYEERRTSIYDASLSYISAGASKAEYSFEAVLDDELSAEVPEFGGDYLPENLVGKFVPFTSEVGDDESLEATIVGASVPTPMGYTFTAGTWYRLVADFVEGYNDAPNKLIDTVNEVEIFGEGTIRMGNKLHCLIRAEHPYDEAVTHINGFTFQVYEVPDRSFHAFKGGWDFRQWPSRSTLLPGARQLLSTMPDVRSWHIGQMIWAGVLLAVDSVLYFSASVQYSDGTSASIASVFLGSNPAYRPVLIDISDAERGYSLLNPAKEISKVLATISAPAISFSATLVLVSSYQNAPFRREFHYTNSLGGCDALIAYGKGQAFEEHEAEEYEKYIPIAYSLHDNAQYASISRRPRQGFEVSSGYRSRQERDAAKEILQAEKAFIREGDALVPIIVEAGTVQDEPDGDYRHKLSFRYRYAFDKLSV